MTGQWRFVLITITALLAAGITFSLGRWQLSRAAEKETRQAATESQSRLSPLGTEAFAAMADPAVAIHRIAKLRGTWVVDRTFFLDNRQMNDKVGFFVVTPLKLEGSANAILVQRGWVPRNFIDRVSVPQMATASGLVEILTRIAPPPGKLFELGAVGAGQIRQNLDLPSLRAETGLALMPVSALQLGPPSDGLLRDWPVIGASADKNYGYAFQWFGLCALITLLYVWFQIVKRFIAARA